MEEVHLTLSESSAKRISILYEVAKSQGSLISLQELVPLLPEKTTEMELAEAFSTFPSLGSRFELKWGYVTEKYVDADGETQIDTERAHRKTAVRNISYGAQFVPMLHSVPFRMVGISGSTSYLSAAHSQDLDLFCVASQGRMWFSLTQALILARVFSLIRPAAPQICLSCVMDEEYAESAFVKEQGSLFARDALSTMVLTGGDAYQSLMRMAKWISSLYPAAYSLRTKQTTQAPLPRRRPTLIEVTVDRFLYLVVGSFIRMKSSLLNKKLARRRRSDGVFSIRSGPDHLVYESVRYKSLRGEYAGFRTE